MGVTRSPLRIVITSGPTREPIDPVRYLSNYSTGVMGACLAREALKRGHRVTVLAGPGHAVLPEGVRVLPFETAAELMLRLYRLASRADIVIMAAAVADFRPSAPKKQKIKRHNGLSLDLEATPDVIGGFPRRESQVLVGFALETETPAQAGLRKLRRKRLDLLLAQDAGYAKGPFGKGRLKAWLVDGSGSKDLGVVTKPRVARLLLDKSEALWYGRKARSLPGSTKL